MLKRFVFFPVFLSLMLVLGWMSKGIRLSSVAVSSESARELQQGEEEIHQVRQELMEVLDHIAHQQQAYQAMTGHYTQILGQVGFSPSRRLAGRYEFRIVRASQDRFLVHAFSERKGKVEDLISIDQDFEVQANFTLPAPRAEFLKAHTLRHLRQFGDRLRPGEILSEGTLFSGYFRYESRKDSKGRSVVAAVGLRSPVQGVQLELAESQTEEELMTAMQEQMKEWLNGSASAAVPGEMARRPGSVEQHSESPPSRAQSQNIDTQHSLGHARHDLIVEPIPTSE